MNKLERYKKEENEKKKKMKVLVRLLEWSRKLTKASSGNQPIMTDKLS